MAQKNETPALILSLVITLALLGTGLWWLTTRLNLGNMFQSGNPGLSGPGRGSTKVAERFSQGDKLLFSEGATAEKQAAIAAIANGDYAAARTNLEASLQKQRNDPEALIYLNNARIGNASSYTIAVPVPIATDPNGSLEILRGVAQAQNDLNKAGGINTTLLRVEIADDGNDPAIAQQVANALVKDADILGVEGHYASDVSLAAGEVYQANGLVAISPVSSSVKLSNFGDYIFRTVPSDFVAARALASYMLETLQQQRATLYFNSQSGYSQSLMSEFSSALALGGGQVVSQFDLSDPNFNAASSVAESAQRGATVLVLVPNTGQLDRALQVVQEGQGRFALLGGDDVYTSKTLQVGGQAASGMVVAVPWHLLAHPNAPFVTTSRQLWGGDVNWRTVTAYDATQALVQALRQGASPTRDSIQQALRGGTFEAAGATEAVQFLPSGDRNQTAQLVKITPGRRSGLGYDFVPLNP